MYKTSDGGLNWSNIYDFGSANNFGNKGVRFFNENNGFIIFGNKFFKTANGGASFTEHTISSNIYNNSGTYFLDENNGWAIVTEKPPPDYIDRYYIYKTNNGGISWNNISRIESGGIMSSIKFINQNEGYLASEFFIFKTTNSGTNWNLYCTPENTYYQYVELINNEPSFFSRTGILSRPTGVIDSTKWTAKGKLTNSAILLITDTYDQTFYANGSVSRNSSNVNFSCSNYSGGGNRFGSGGGTYSFDSGFLNIVLDLPNNEKWKIKLRR